MVLYLYGIYHGIIIYTLNIMVFVVSLYIYTHFWGYPVTENHGFAAYRFLISGGAAAEGWRICANAGRRRLRLGQPVEKLT